MLKKAAVLLLCLTFAFGLFSCSDTTVRGDKNGKISVYVTFNALKEFALAVGGDKITVSTIIPDGTEVHDFEPTAQSLAGMTGADVFIYNGLGIEPWAEDAIKAANNPELVTVEASKGGDFIENTAKGQESLSYDPHIWLSPKGAQTAAKNIRDALIKADPDNITYYTQNCNVFVAELEALSSEYYAKFAALENKVFVTGHAAFGYLCRDFALTQESVSDIYSEGEPSARQLVELVEFCRQKGVTTVFAEAAASAAVTETLATEVGAKVESIYTIETAENGQSYIDRMRANLQKIYESLK